ncbi:hypothetical protein Goe26_00960 [Bacillus phage vB_BsuM-Goe26]|nr:hypothetical protein Goe26_00960 [Bacillus phage vB_BsuM-Goe26]
MELLTKEQLKAIAKIIQDHVGVLVNLAVGNREVDGNLLKKLGIPIDAPSIIENAFVLGKLVQLLREKDLKQMSFDDLKEESKKMRLSVVERNSLEFSKKSAAKYVTALGQRIKNKINTDVELASQKVNLEVAERDIVRDKISQGILKQRTRTQLASDLGHELDDWKRDWRRVAHTELWNAKLQGEVVTILQGESIYSNGSRGDTLVFRRPAPDACSHCKRLYLEPDMITPKLFRLSELVNNGTNVGKKVAEWKPITGTTHPNCSCPIAVMPDGFGFNEHGQIEFKG